MFNFFKKISSRKKAINGFNEIILSNLTLSQREYLVELLKCRQFGSYSDNQKLPNLSDEEIDTLIWIFSLKSVPEEIKEGAMVYHKIYYNKYQSVGFSERNSVILAGIDWLDFKL